MLETLSTFHFTPSPSVGIGNAQSEDEFFEKKQPPCIQRKDLNLHGQIFEFIKTYSQIRKQTIGGLRRARVQQGIEIRIIFFHSLFQIHFHKREKNKQISLLLRNNYRLFDLHPSRVKV